MKELRVFILLLLFVLIVVALVVNAINAIENSSIQSAFFAGMFFWIIIDSAFKTLVIDRIGT